MKWVLCSPLNSFTEAKPPMWWYWWWDFWEVVRFRLGQEGEKFKMELEIRLEEQEEKKCPYKKKEKEFTFLFMSMHQEKAPFTIRKKTLTRTRHASTLISHFQPPELWENKCLFFKSSSLLYFCFVLLFQCSQCTTKVLKLGYVAESLEKLVCVCVCVCVFVVYLLNSDIVKVTCK